MQTEEDQGTVEREKEDTVSPGESKKQRKKKL